MMRRNEDRRMGRFTSPGTAPELVKLPCGKCLSDGDCLCHDPVVVPATWINKQSGRGHISAIAAAALIGLSGLSVRPLVLKVFMGLGLVGLGVAMTQHTEDVSDYSLEQLEKLSKDDHANNKKLALARAFDHGEAAMRLIQNIASEAKTGSIEEKAAKLYLKRLQELVSTK